MGFNKGAQSIAQEEKAAQEARKAAFTSDRLDYLSVKDGETAYIRLITPASDWIKVAQHSFVKTKPAPDGVKSWPKGMGGVCRYDKQIQSILNTADCYVCDNQLQVANRKDFAKPSPRCWALAVLRQQVRSADGRLEGYDDVREEYEILDADKKGTGKKAERVKFVIVNMTWRQIFATLAHAEENYPGGVCGRDFAIRRTGEGTDTEYQVLPLDPIPDLAPGTEPWKRYTDEMERREISLEDIVLKQAGDEHYARWFDPTKAVEKGEIVTVTPGQSSGSSNGDRPAASAGDEPESAEMQEKLAAMRQRLIG